MSKSHTNNINKNGMDWFFSYKPYFYSIYLDFKTLFRARKDTGTPGDKSKFGLWSLVDFHDQLFQPSPAEMMKTITTTSGTRLQILMSGHEHYRE